MITQKDFRCNEIIEDLYRQIENYMLLERDFSVKTEQSEEESYEEYLHRKSKAYFEFYKKNRVKIEIIANGLSCKNNYILIESVESCFLINLNFELLGIINNIKNRLPNIEEKYPMFQEVFQEVDENIESDKLRVFGNEFYGYFLDLHFMARYWRALLDYLGYDPNFIKIFKEVYNSKYNVEEDIKLPREIQEERVNEVKKEVAKAIWKYKISHFWD